MEINKPIVDPLHIFDEHSSIAKAAFNHNKVLIVSYNIKNYFLIKKEEDFNSTNKYSFINRLEKSFELIHPAIIRLSGFSIKRPYLYYKYINRYNNISQTRFSDENIQKIFLGIASALSYLFFNGFFNSNFSIDSIIFDEENCPRLIDYVDFDEGSKNITEEDLVKKYVDVVKKILDKKKKQDSIISLNKEFNDLIKKVDKHASNITFDVFINFLKSKSYCNANDFLQNQSFKNYIEKLQLADKICYFNEDLTGYDGFSLDLGHSVERIPYFFYKNKDIKKITKHHMFALNLLPEYYVKSLSKVVNVLSDKFARYLYHEDFSLIFPEWKKNYDSNRDSDYYSIYTELMKGYQILENKKNEIDCFNKEKKDIENKMDAIRIKCIHFLKLASKNSNDAKVKIELAVQYLKGSLLPYNLKKALKTLNEIKNADKSTTNLIEQMKQKIVSNLESNKIENIKKTLTSKQITLLNNSFGKNEDVLSLLLVAFSFYTGFDKYPILRSFSIYCYRKAAKISPDAMTLLGYLYFKGVIFPQNYKRAKKNFKLAADNGCSKAEIIDSLLRKHLWRTYLCEFEIDNLFGFYLSSFKSCFPNDSYVFPSIIYGIENNENQFVNKLINKEDNKLYTDNIYENHSMFLNIEKSYVTFNRMQPIFSQKILLPENIDQEDSKSDKEENKDNPNNAKNEAEYELKIGKYYYYGDNYYPINYEKAAEFFKKAADKGNSEAQWRYALMCENLFGIDESIGKVHINELKDSFLQKSANQDNTKGKLLYAIYLKERGNKNLFEEIILEICESKNNEYSDLDAMHYYAMHLENFEKNFEQSMCYYQKAANKGHFESLIRLIYLVKIMLHKELYEEYLKYSIGILNESLLVRLINFFDKKEEYDQSNILIQIVISLNYQLFNAYLADHLLYSKKMKEDVKKAEKLAFLAYREKYDKKYLERYIYVILEIYIRNKEYQKAADFLLEHKSELTEKYRKVFLSFYQKFNKNIANSYYITVNFCNKYYQYCHIHLMEFQKVKNVNFFKAIIELQKLAIYEENPYANVIVGKIYKQGKFIMRNLRKAIKYFIVGAKKGCPEGYYYLGKELYYGRFLDQNNDLARKYFCYALRNCGEPRAGYLLYKLGKHRKVDDVKALEIAVSFGYKRALYKYGHRLITGKDKRIIQNVPKGINVVEKGKELIKQSAYQHYKKAIRYCKNHGINYKENIDNNNKTNFIKISNVNSVEIQKDKEIKKKNSQLINSDVKQDDDSNIINISIDVDDDDNDIISESIITESKKSSESNVPIKRNSFNLDSINVNEKNFSSSKKGNKSSVLNNNEKAQMNSILNSLNPIDNNPDLNDDDISDFDDFWF